MIKQNKKPRIGTSIVIVTSLIIMIGCDSLRFAPSEPQKQNAYLHHRTMQAAAIQSQNEQASQTLRELAANASKQAEAIVTYYGLPKELPLTDSVDQILSPANAEITAKAQTDSLARPDPWDVADNLLELGIAIAGVIGGVYGTRAIAAMKTARQKSDALRQIITGNELFKQNHPDSAETFKESHQHQSQTTRSLVATMK